MPQSDAAVSDDIKHHVTVWYFPGTTPYFIRKSGRGLFFTISAFHKEGNKSMKGIFGLDGGVMNFLTKVSDICLISMLWLICCLPLVTIGASTTAAYYTIVKVVRRQIGTMHKEFFRSFRSNLKESFIINLIYLLIEGILVFNIYTVYQSLQTTDSVFAFNLLFFYVIVFVLVIGAGIYTYPVLSRFAMGRFALVKFSLFCMFRHLPTTILLLAVFLVSVVVGLLFPPGLIFMPGICLYLYSLFMERILWRYMTQDMRRAWNEAIGLDENGKPIEAADSAQE